MPLQPTVVLTTPYPTPPNSYRTSKVSDMYTIAWDTTPNVVSYDVGVDPKYSKRMTIRNEAVNNRLKIDIIVPPWIHSSATSFVLDPDDSATVTFELIEPQLISMAKSKIYSDEQDVNVNITPINVINPIYVKRVRSSLTV